MNNLCTDNRFELIEKYKKALIEATNIETSADEMKVIDNVLFRFWQMGWLEKLETKDAVEAVRCKDCKFYGFFGRVNICKRWNGDPYKAPIPKEEGFCSYGERRDDGEIRIC